jgi:carnitinyl-coA dehydratase
MSNIVTTVEDMTLIVKINRPQKMNAINDDVLADILEVFATAEADPLIKVIILTGTGNEVFSSGADLECLANDAGLLAGFADVVRSNVSKPLIVAVNGSAFGGAVEFMLLGDIVIVERGRKFSFPEVRFGFFPAAGGVLKLPKLISWSTALDLLLSGDEVGAERIYELGLASRLVDRGRALEEAVRIARRVGSYSSVAVTSIKYMATMSLGNVPNEFWDVNFSNACDLINSEEVRERLSAFINRRTS